MAKVSIITRAYNKLEYTIKCIDSVAKYTNYSNYEHIIINNGSQDGTKEWLNWVDSNDLPFFSRVRVFNMEKNYGDWGGMLKGMEFISDESEYIVQMDNDIEVRDIEWMNKMMFLLENTDVKIIQLRRMGMYNFVQPINIKEIDYNGETLRYGNHKANRPVALFMLKTSDFQSVKDKLPLNLHQGKSHLSRLLGGTHKFENVECHMLDGYHPRMGKHFYDYKYPRKLTYQRVNIID